MHASWHDFSAQLVLLLGLIGALSAQLAPIFSLGKALNYPMPNTDNCCTWPGVKCFSALEPEEINWDFYNLTGTIPATFSGPFANLRTLRLANNKNITANLDAYADNPLAYFPVLQELRLAGNFGVTGSISVNFLRLPKLITLDLSYTSVSGDINFPFGLGPTPLKNLLIENAKLTGNFPSWLPDAENLTNVKLGLNQLTGDLPENIASLTELVELNIYLNLLTGTIPAAYSALTKLRILRLGRNQFTGPIPDIFSGMPDLDTFEASYTGLTGVIPSSLATRPNLKQLILPGSGLSGQIPFFAGPLTYL